MIRAVLASATGIAAVLTALGAAWISAGAPRALPQRPIVVRAEAPSRAPRITFGAPQIVPPPAQRPAPPRPHPAITWRCHWHDAEQGIRACEFVGATRS